MRWETALPLSATEARQVIAAAQTHGNSARWTVALAVGLRQSEALGLRWADVDLEKGALSVRRGLHRVGGQGLVYEEPKADRGPARPTRRGAPGSPGSPTRGAHRRRTAVAGPRPGLRPAQRPADRAPVGLALVEGPPARSGRARDPVTRRGGTRRPRCCSRKTCTPGSSWRSWATRRCERRRTPTATRLTAWEERCGTDLAPHSLQWPPRWHQKRPRPLSRRRTAWS